MSQTELQELMDEYADDEISEQEYEQRLDDVDFDEEPPTLRERYAAHINMATYIALTVIFISLIFVTKGQILVVAPPLAAMAALLYVLWQVTKWEANQ